MDARPLFKKYEIPALKTVKIKSNELISNWTSSTLKKSMDEGSLETFGDLHKGLIATGDKFISKKNDLENISIKVEKMKS